jgi:glycosyltransferase involved in cell wall biosynthesis
MAKLSVVVPFYNVGRYLDELLDSLCSQEMEELEILLIDDCSTDNSYAKAMRYAANDPRIRVLQQDRNRGSGGGRNWGIKEATGDYIWFVDGDDAVTPRIAASHLYETAARENCDILVFSALFYPDDLQTPLLKRHNALVELYSPLRQPGVFEGREACHNFVCTNGFNSQVCWINLYRRRFLIENNYTFLENTIHQDAILLLWPFNAQKIVSLPFIGYYYRTSSASSSRSKTKTLYYENGLRVISQLDDFYKEYQEQFSIADQAVIFSRILSLLCEKPLAENYVRFTRDVSAAITEAYSSLLLKLNILSNDDRPAIISEGIRLTTERFKLPYLNILEKPLLINDKKLLYNALNRFLRLHYKKEFKTKTLRRRLKIFLPYGLVFWEEYRAKLRKRFRKTQF